VVELERLTEVLYVERPVQGLSGNSVGLSKVKPGGRAAERVMVRLGRSSVNTIEIVSGLEVADKVLLNDMSSFDAHEHVGIR
ncbi:MAG: RND transporter, partial [Verrucomicrobiae bacterium]|nr:RND transporter [Verrucomicrobiae bacterium]